jgi:photosystem II stability/assembly factor-like uncharacterized protein
MKDEVTRRIFKVSSFIFHLSSLWMIAAPLLIAAGHPGKVTAQSVVRINPAHLTIRGAALYSDTGMMVGDSGLVMRYLGFAASKYVQLDAKISKSVTLYAVAFTNQLRAAIGGSGGTLSYTFNCGATWTPSSIGTTATIRALASNGSGVLMGVGDSGLLIRSTNGGRSWTRLPSPTSVQLNALSFGTPDSGVAVGNDTVILQTVNSGQSWSRIPFPYDLRPYDSIVHRIDFSSVSLTGNNLFTLTGANILWVGIERPVMPLRLLRNTNGSWKKDTAVPPLFPNSGPLRALVMASGILIGLASDDYLYYRDPAAPGWSRRTRDAFGDADGNTDPSPMRNYCAAVGNSSTGTIVTFGGEELHSYEGVNYDSYGAWQQNTYPNGRDPTNFLGVSILPDGFGYAAGTGATMERTTDSGRTWKPTTFFGQDLKFNNVFCLGATSALICGWDGLIQHTQDGGKSWDSLNSGTHEKLHGIAFPSTDIGIIAGDYGNIIRSTDTGKSWTPVSTPTTQFLYSVAFANDQIGITGGDAGTILRTTDAGLHWSDVNNVLSDTKSSIRQVEAFPDGTFFARASTLLIRSTDFGQNWQFVSLPIGDSLGMSFYNPKIGIVAERATSSARVPDTAYCSFTTNGGAKWTPFVVPIWNYNRILFHWLNDHQVLLYGIEGVVVLVDISGSSGVKITRVEATGPRAALAVYPNPSTGEVRVAYATKTNGPVQIELWDEAGQKVRILWSTNETPGDHARAIVLPKELHGAYFIRIVKDGEVSTAPLRIR